MFNNYKVYNVDVFDIEWQGIGYYPNLPTEVVNFEVFIPINSYEYCDEEDMLNHIFNKIIKMYKENTDDEDDYLCITQAKVKVNSTYYFSILPRYDTTRD